MQVYEGTKGGLIKAWTEGVQVEAAASDQIMNMASMPFIHRHIAIMPDVHWGMGATVGSVIPTKGAIIPAAVGVDIGCGMIAQRTSLTAADLPDNLHALRTEIERRIPHGRTNGGRAGDRGAWGDVPDETGKAFRHFASNASSETSLEMGLKRIIEKHPKIGQAGDRAPQHLGTLGGGNHFVEVCLDTEDRVWVMLHSGSRGIGNKIGSYFIEKAKEDMRRWFINLPDQDLAYFPEGSENFNDYWKALHWAQKFAKTNRDLMMTAALGALSTIVPKTFSCDCDAVNCHHNYASREHHFGQDVILTRKGAVKIGPGERGIIPGSMGAKSFIVEGIEGKALAESFCSCSHGAGRAMSRNEAKKRFTVADHEKATEGVECRKGEDVIDETPGAYKDVEAVMKAQDDHVAVLATLKQVLCVKG